MDINEILKSQNITILEKDNGEIHIKNRSMMNGCLALISILVGILSIFLVIIKPSLIILTLLLCGAPFIYSKWKYPKKIIIDHNKQVLISIKPFSFPERFNLNELNSVKVQASTRNSYTSAFAEGNKDHNYYFHIDLKESTYKFKLMVLQFRTNCDNDMSILAEYLTTKIKSH